MMKANKQIGFIYKNGESIDRILKDGDVVFERGFLREKASTTLPITFGGVGKDLKDYRVYGNTVQNGEPTPDTPIDMVSCGDRTKNLFDISQMQVGYINNSGGLITSSQYTTHAEGYVRYIKVKPNITYTFNIIETPDNYTPQWLGIAEYSSDSADTFIKNAVRNNANVPFTFTTGSTTNYLCVSGRNMINATKIQLEEGDTATPYEPYGKYKIPVNVRSDNLYDKNKNTQNYYLDINGNNESNTSWDITDYIPVIPNNNYTYKGITNPGTAPYCAYYDKNKNFVSSFKSQMYTNNIVIPNNIYYIRFSLCKTTSNYNIDTFEIIRNETTNIYLDEPLRKIDEYSDYIDFINGKVVRNIYEYKITGNEKWEKQYGNNLFDAQECFNDKPFILSYGLCNMYKYNSVQSGIDANTVNGEFALQKILSVSTGIMKYNLLIKNTSYSDKDLFKTYLQNLYNNNTPVIINYPLETTTEEDIELPNIPTIDGNNTLNIETEITPSKVYIKYKSNN